MLTFQKMSDAEFKLYEAQAIIEYAENKKQAEHITAEAALKLAQDSYSELIPNGIHTKGHYFYSIISGGKSIGMIWVADQTTVAYIYDFLIDEKFRGKGYGKASLAWLETEVLKLGFKAIKLHVFEHNHYARSLYEKVGYFATGRSMIKNLNVPGEKIHRE